MSGTIRFDEENIVHFVLNKEAKTITLEVITDGDEYTQTVALEEPI